MLVDADLQTLQAWGAVFMKVIMESTKKMPYGTRYLARETLNALRVSKPQCCIDKFLISG